MTHCLNSSAGCDFGISQCCGCTCKSCLEADRELKAQSRTATAQPNVSDGGPDPGKHAIEILAMLADPLIDEICSEVEALAQACRQKGVQLAFLDLVDRYVKLRHSHAELLAAARHVMAEHALFSANPGYRPEVWEPIFGPLKAAIAKAVRS